MKCSLVCMVRMHRQQRAAKYTFTAECNPLLLDLFNTHFLHFSPKRYWREVKSLEVGVGGGVGGRERGYI